MCSIGDGKQHELSVIYTKSDFTELEWNVLKARTGLKLKGLCANHYKIYCIFYESHQTKCCDPFLELRHEGRPIKGNLRTVTLEMYMKSRAVLEFRRRLIPGEKLCKRCSGDANKILKLADPGEPLSSASSFSASQDVPQDNPDRIPADSKQAEGGTQTSDSRSAPQSQDILESADVRQAGTQTSDCKSAPTSAPQSQDMFADDENENLGDDSSAVGKTYQGRYVTSFGRLSTLKQQGKLDESIESSQGSDSSYELNPQHPTASALTKINESLQVIGVSPVRKRMLTDPVYIPTKLQRIGEEYESLMTTSASSTSVSTQPDFESKVIEALQQKMLRSNPSEKILGVSVALTAYSQRKVLDVFGKYGATDWLVRKTHHLMEEQDGLFPDPLPKRGRSIPEETQTLVINFYENDEYSRQLPGKKDYVSVRINGQRVHVQKRLILSNLRELYSVFKTKLPHIPLSFSKFAALRPRHCVLAGAAGTHSICVCKYHQNFKLMLDGAKFKQMNFNLVTYKDVIQSVICETPDDDCYLKPFCEKSVAF